MPLTDWRGDELQARIHNAADRALAKLALSIEADAKAEAPVRGGYRSFRPGTKPIGGALRRSITTAPPGGVGPLEGGGDATANVRGGAILVGSWLAYSLYVERGTYKMASRPYLLPALDKNVKSWPNRLLEELRAQS